MSGIALRSALRLIALSFALGCGWVAIATAQEAYVPVCLVGGDSRAAHTITGPATDTGLVSGPCAFPLGTTWLAGPTAAMSVALLAALALVLLAVSPRQASILAYRWRRAVY